MTTQIHAIYENGTFRPATPVLLDEGTQVVLTIDTNAPLRPSPPLVAALMKIASMPTESPNDGFSGADHDEILYGPEGAR